MSSNLPESTGVSLPPCEPASPSQSSARNKRCTEWLIAGVLFFLTLISATLAGAFANVWGLGPGRIFRIIAHNPEVILQGLSFSIPLISILLAHELGHYFTCKYYAMHCTPPFFIPVPIPITGTMGAFIRIKSAFINRRSLFDIGISGPLAGFAFIMPFLCIGIRMSHLMPKGTFPPGDISFGEPLIFRIAGALLLGYSPDSHILIAHPIAMAAWVGLLATSLNLLPIWQLDGGHIAYAILGRSRQRSISMAGIAMLLVLSLWDWRTPSYLLFALMLLIFGWRVRFYHPRTLYDDDAVGKGRVMLGWIALLILVVSFIPVPVSIEY